MATFQYEARDQSGGALSGQLTAGSATEATRTLRSEGKFVVKLQELTQALTSQQAIEITGSSRVSRTEVIFFLTQLSMMIEAGVPIAEALEGMIRQTKPGGLRTVLSSVLRNVEDGSPLSDALAAHPTVFTSLVVQLTKAAEMSGRLAEALDRISSHLASQRDIIVKVRRALLYPMFLATMGFGIIIFLMTYLLPKFTVIYKGKEELLPVPTQIVIAISRWTIDYWPYWVAGLIAAVVGLALYLRTPQGRRASDWLLLSFPILGPMVKKSLLTRSLHTLGTLIYSGVSMLDSVAITKRVAGNFHFEQLWDDVNRNLQQGMQLSAPLYNSSLFPRPLTQMIEAGERSGQIGQVMKRISGWLEEDLKESISSTTKLIEPLMILIIGSAVGGIAIALLLPIFSMAKMISR